MGAIWTHRHFQMFLFSMFHLLSNYAGTNGSGQHLGKVDGNASSVMSEAEMAAALNGDAAYALRNISVEPSGKIEIADEFRSDLRKQYTDSQIDRGLDRAPARCANLDLSKSRNLLKLRDAIRSCASYAKQDDEKEATRLAKMRTGSGSRAL